MDTPVQYYHRFRAYKIVLESDPTLFFFFYPHVLGMYSKDVLHLNLEHHVAHVLDQSTKHSKNAKPSSNSGSSGWFK
jgi:hypothetical protein